MQLLVAMQKKLVGCTLATGVNGSTIIFCFWRIESNWVSTLRLKKHCSGKFNKKNSEDSIEYLSYTKRKIYYYKLIPMSITPLSCYLILLIIDANPVGCTETQVGQLLCRCTLWCNFCWFTSDGLEWENSVGWTVSCPLGVGGGWRQDWRRWHCISPTLVLVWWGCYCRRACHLWLSSWVECDSKHHISAAKSILDFVTCTRVILCCWLR